MDKVVTNPKGFSAEGLAKIAPTLHIYTKDIDQIAFGLALSRSTDIPAAPEALRPRLTVVPTET